MRCLGAYLGFKRSNANLKLRSSNDHARLVDSKGRMRRKNPLTQGWVQAHNAPTTRRLLGALALCWCTPALCGAPLAAASAPILDAITSITLERNCFGCAGASVLAVQRDGQARYTVFGNARHGTTDQVHIGRVSAKDFEALARLALQQGFFELQDSYADPQVQDGAWTSTRIVRGAQDKQVLNRNEAGPAALQALERGVDALKTRIKFAPPLR